MLDINLMYVHRSHTYLYFFNVGGAYTHTAKYACLYLPEKGQVSKNRAKRKATYVLKGMSHEN